MTKRFSELSAPIDADPQRHARVEGYQRAMRDAVALTELRESRRATQTQVADAPQVSQAKVSRIEHQEDLYLSTLGDYVAALGGRLEIAAVFPDETIVFTPPSRERAGGDSARAEGVAATGELEPEAVQPVRPSQGQRALPDE